MKKIRSHCHSAHLPHVAPAASLLIISTVTIAENLNQAPAYVGKKSPISAMPTDQNTQHWQIKWQDGKAIIPLHSNNADFFTNNGLARVKQGDKWGFINSQDEVVIPLQDDNGDSLTDNSLAEVKKTISIILLRC